MKINSFDCYCQGESVKGIRKIKLYYRGKIETFDIIGWYSASNHHFFYIMRPDGLKQYYFSECRKEIKLENKTYEKIDKILKNTPHIWIKCKNLEEIKKMEGIFYDLWGEELNCMDNSQFCRFAKELMHKDREIPKHILLSNLLEGQFKKGMDNWVYVSALNSFVRDARNFVILSLKSKFVDDEINIKEIKYNEIC